MTLNVRGLGVGKWLHNLGAVGLWVPALLLMALAAVSYARFGSATPFTAESLVPSTRLKDIIFWSTIAFSLSGLESASMMGDEIRDPRRNIPRALLIGGVLITLLYILSTVAMLVALPQSKILSLQGFMLSIQETARKVGVGGLTGVVALLITLGGLGQAGAWFAAGGRLPFVAGIDRFLPAAFGRVHPKYGSPHVSLLVQAAVAAVFIFLGQAGTTVKGAYDVLVSMAIIGYFIPYLFMFASMIKLQSEPAGPEVIRVPGGRPVATLLGGLGLPGDGGDHRPGADPGGGRDQQGARGHQGGGFDAAPAGGRRGGLSHRQAEAGVSAPRVSLRELDAARWRVALGLTAVMVVLYFGFILLVAYGRDLLARPVVPGLTLGILLGALVIVASWLLTWVYVRWAATHYDPGIRALGRER